MTPVRLEPAALRSRVKHSTTEPLRSLFGFNEPVYETLKLVLIVHALSCSLKMYAQLSSGDRDLIVGLSLYSHPYFLCV